VSKVTARFVTRTALLACMSGSAPGLAHAADPVTLSLKDHQFTPREITVPAGERIRVAVENADSTPAEFESSDLRIEKIVTAGGRITVFIGPLKPGTYKFFDDYHPDVATGTVTALEKKE
jgi:heme/copper-type cytochrome/quinol oxidase subunit 2